MPDAATTTTTLSAKGQVILPAAIRKRRQWSAGTRLSIEETPDGVLLKPAPWFPRTRPEQVFGYLRYTGQPKTIAKMQQVIEAEARQRHARGRY